MTCGLKIQVNNLKDSRGEIKNMTKKPRIPKEDKKLKTKNMTILEKIVTKLKEYTKTGKSKPTTLGKITINKTGEIKIKNVK
jgi:hypothetical protein